MVLINSNPATIMTDSDIADKVYIEPLTVPRPSKSIIDKEQPDSMLADPGRPDGPEPGHGAGRKRLLGGARRAASSGTKRRDHPQGGGPAGVQGDHGTNRRAAASTVGDRRRRGRRRWPLPKRSAIPVIVRPAYTLGGTGGGIADNREELAQICATRPAPVAACTRC